MSKDMEFMYKILEAIGYEKFDPKRMSSMFMVALDSHDLCSQDVVYAKHCCGKLENQWGKPTKIFNEALIFNWLFMVDYHSQLLWGAYKENMDSEAKYRPLFEGNVFCREFVSYYRYKGAPVDPSNMLYVVEDWDYLKQAHGIMRKLDELFKGGTYAFCSFDTLPYWNKLHDQFVELYMLFYCDIVNTTEFETWAMRQYGLDTDAIADMKSRQIMNQETDLVKYVEEYVNYKAGLL